MLSLLESPDASILFMLGAMNGDAPNPLRFAIAALSFRTNNKQAKIKVVQRKLHRPHEEQEHHCSCPWVPVTAPVHVHQYQYSVSH